jgi:hypothetical protein
VTTTTPFSTRNGRPTGDTLARNETLTRHRLRHLRGNLHRAGLVGRLHGETSSACALPVAGSRCGTVRDRDTPQISGQLSERLGRGWHGHRWPGSTGRRSAARTPGSTGRRSAANLLRSNPHARGIMCRSNGITQAGVTCTNVSTLVSGHHKSTVSEISPDNEGFRDSASGRAWKPGTART